MWGQWAFDKEREQILFLPWIVLEGEKCRTLLQEKIEGVVNRHFGYYFYLNLEFPHGFWERQSRIPIGKGVLLPVDEVFTPGDFLGVAQDWGPAVRGGPESDDVRSVLNGTIVLVVRDMLERDVDGHGKRVVFEGQVVNGASDRADSIQFCTPSGMVWGMTYDKMAELFFDSGLGT